MTGDWSEDDRASADHRLQMQDYTISSDGIRECGFDTNAVQFQSGMAGCFGHRVAELVGFAQILSLG